MKAIAAFGTSAIHSAPFSRDSLVWWQ